MSVFPVTVPPLNPLPRSRAEVERLEADAYRAACSSSMQPVRKAFVARAKGLGKIAREMAAE